MTSKISTPTEYEEACTFVDWLELMKNQGKILDYCHIANESYGGTRADMLRGAKLKRIGRKRGVFDYQVFARYDQKIVGLNGRIRKGQLLCIELKKRKGGKTSEEQTYWKNLYEKCFIPAKICHGADEAIEFVKRFIE